MDLALLAIMEYALSHERNDLAQCLTEDVCPLLIDTAVDPSSPLYEQIKNVKSQFIIRRILIALEEEDPALEKQQKLLTALLIDLGPLFTIEETVKIIIDMAFQSYMHRIHKLRINQEETFRALQEFHQSVLAQVEEDRKEFLERREEGVDVGLEKALLLKLRKLLAKITNFIRNWTTFKDRIVLLNDFIEEEEWNFEEVRERIQNFLQNLQESLPQTLLDSLLFSWKKTNGMLPNQMSTRKIQESCSLTKYMEIHAFKNREVHNFIVDHDVEPLIELSTTPIPTQRRSARLSTISPSPSSPPFPNENDCESEGSSIEWNLSGDEEEEGASADPETPRREFSPSQVATPVVASELRNELEELSRLNGSDPLVEAQVSSQLARKRIGSPLGTSPIGKKQKTDVNAVVWDSDSDGEAVEETIQFSQPQNIASIEDRERELLPEQVVHHPTTIACPTRRRWNDEEVHQLIEGVRLFGKGNWKLILDNFKFEGRTGVNLKDKYRNLRRHYSDEYLMGKENK